MRISIVCIGIKEEGNIGAIARAMKNFGFDELLLIDCCANHLSKTALDRASHAKGILKNAKKISGIDALKKPEKKSGRSGEGFGYKRFNYKRFDYIIGTTAKLGTDYNIPRSPLTPKQLGEKLKGICGVKDIYTLKASKISPINIAFLFGREDHGLSNDEISQCDFIVSIPSSKEYPVMNVSHACAVILYEIFNAINTNDGTNNQACNKTSVSHIPPASGIDKEHAVRLCNEALDTMKFPTPDKKKTQQVLWKKIIGKSFLTKREIYALMGFFKKILGRR